MLLIAALMQAAMPTTPAPVGNPGLELRLQARYEACLEAVEKDAAAGYETAMAWAAEAYSPHAMRCSAMALIELGRIEDGADRLASIAASSAGGAPEVRIGILAQAANAYLLARLPDKAKAAMDRAISLTAADDPGLPDLLIDRARALAMLQNWRGAEEDLSRTIDLRPDNGLALRLRAAARMRQGVFDLALRDAEAAVALEPRNIEALLVRGQAIEAKRTGRPPE